MKLWSEGGNMKQKLMLIVASFLLIPQIALAAVPVVFTNGA